MDYSLCDCGVYRPIAFTPNGDANNNDLLVKTTCPIKTFELRILDRWGKTVFFTRDPDFNWDGKSQDGITLDGVFSYFLYYQYLESGKQFTKLKKGHITIVI